jgi:hypothetical protein
MMSWRIHLRGKQALRLGSQARRAEVDGSVTAIVAISWPPAGQIQMAVDRRHQLPAARRRTVIRNGTAASCAATANAVTAPGETPNSNPITMLPTTHAVP